MPSVLAATASGGALVSLQMPGPGCSADPVPGLSEMGDPVWVLTGLEHPLFSAWD